MKVKDSDGPIQYTNGPCAQEPQGPEMATDGKNVSALVTKSKKAATSLFTLLHAKNCKLGVHRCSHPGCAEAKLIYLHLKTCTSFSSLEPCPSNHKGCADSRKLLSHYRRCRDIRSRQVANRSNEPQHICLVCSLVARHAKGTPDRSRSTSPNCARVSVMGPPPSKFSFSNRATKQSMNVSFHIKSAEDMPNLKFSAGVRHRPRSESLDIRRTPQDLEEDCNDPLQTNREELEGQPIVHRRRRSASCSVLVPSSSERGSGPFDPILEEPVGDELQRVFEGDSAR